MFTLLILQKKKKKKIPPHCQVETGLPLELF